MDIRLQSTTAPGDAEREASARRCPLQRHGDRMGRLDAESAGAARREAPRDGDGIACGEPHGLTAATGVDVGADVHLAIDRAAGRAGLLAEVPLRKAGSPRVPRAGRVAA